MIPIKRHAKAALLAILAISGLLAVGWVTAHAGAPPQEAVGESQPSGEEPLPDFKPSERLPADSAVAFPTDI